MVEYQALLLDGVFHALSDATRRQMLGSLKERARTVSELAEPCAMSLAAASKHIKVLEAAGMIERTVQGRTHICRLKPEPLASANEWLAHYQQFWSDRLDALDAALRADEPTIKAKPTKKVARNTSKKGKK